MPANSAISISLRFELKFYGKKNTNVCVLLKTYITSIYDFKKSFNLLIAYNIISHIVQKFFYLKTKLELGKFTKTNSVQSRTERHPYSLARLDEMKKKTNEHYIVLGAMNISF